MYKVRNKFSCGLMFACPAWWVWWTFIFLNRVDTIVCKWCNLQLYAKLKQASHRAVDLVDFLRRWVIATGCLWFRKGRSYHAHSFKKKCHEELWCLKQYRVSIVMMPLLFVMPLCAIPNQWIRPCYHYSCSEHTSCHIYQPCTTLIAWFDQNTQMLPWERGHMMP